MKEGPGSEESGRAEPIAADAPQLLFVDLKTNRLTSEVRLTGVRAGQHPLVAPAEGQYPAELLPPGLAWDLARDGLYVVHADEDRVTVVDLAQGTLLKTAAVHPRATLRETLLRWLAPVAEAKTPPTQRHVELSADGTRLYASGHRFATVRGSDGQWQQRRTSLGFQVIETASLTEIDRRNWDVNALALSSDGSILILDYLVEESARPATGDARHRLQILETAHLREIASLDLAPRTLLQGLLPAGQLAYLSGSVQRPGGPRSVLRVLDPDTRQVIAEQKLAGQFGELIPILPVRTPRGALTLMQPPGRAVEPCVHTSQNSIRSTTIRAAFRSAMAW